MSTKTCRERRNHDDAIKAKVAIAAISGEGTLNELSAKYEVHSNQISQWKSLFLENASSVFSGNKSDHVELEKLKQERDSLYQQIGLQTMDIAFLKKLEEIKPSVCGGRIFPNSLKDFFKVAL